MFKLEKVKTIFEKEKESLKYKLIVSFLVISIIPFFIMQMISYYSITENMKDNMQELVNSNLIQTQKTLNLTLESYGDLLYQIYSDEEIIQCVENINNNVDIEINTNMLRRKLKKLCNAKSQIQALTLMTDSGQTIFYDKLTSSSTKSSWININQYNYENVIKNNERILIPTRFAAKIEKYNYYIFHMAHRFVKNTDIDKRIGIIIISIDAKVLNEICNENDLGNKKNGITYIYDKYRNIVFFPDRKKMGRNLSYYHLEEVENAKNFSVKLMENNQYTTDQLEVPKNAHIGITELKDKKTNWTIEYIYDQSELYRSINLQRKIFLLVSFITINILLLIILGVTDRLTSSIRIILKAMNSAGEGELSVVISITEDMHQEIRLIAEHFNRMIANISDLVEKVKIITLKQKESEIKALEAQINPHFLYNTLDTINWKIIEKEEYEISNMINSLATILRYAIQNSSECVKIREELEWVKKYVYLQQSRLSVPFEFILNVDESVLESMIHKLILQPFLENSIIHGFYNVDNTCLLCIEIKDEGSKIRINIIDNGRGMDKETIEKIKQNKKVNDLDDCHIGIDNVIERLEMYYGSSAEFLIESEIGKGVKISITLPKILRK
ncbi:sensor histidine kinase [uncultured Clostridium sp.]|uniref:sensor histidine kinase n=1 Tax=uncultured Clostridium sp. TaxID=59620 RepID=UPI0025904ED1|nr:sensor histidine kinase [uncultured Clostridium sp.]